MKCLRIFGGESVEQPTSPSSQAAKIETKSAKKRGNLFLVKILLLDDQEIVQEISTDMKGGEVLDQVFKRLNLLETPYFGLRYLDRTGQTHWLDATKKVSKRIKGTPSPCTLYFGVKFYAADPCKLVEEITRYHFFLQVKKDILQGRLPVSFDLAAELGSYAVQSELGDFDPRRHQPGYVSELSLFPSQTGELENKIAELHKGLLGLVPAAAEMKFLEKVKWLDLYGVDLHPVMGEGNVEYFLGLTPSGVLVLKNKSKVGYYFWPRITKVYFQRRYFMLRVKDGGTNAGERTFGFELPTRQACKHLWKCCVEHHAFFRLTGGGNVTQSNWNKTPGTPKLSSKAFSFVSKFRYSGRTQKEAMEDAKRNARTPPPEFPRRVSKRQNYLKQRRIIPGSAGNPSFSDSEITCDDKENYRSLNGSIGSSSTLPRTFVSVPQPAKVDSNGAIQRSESPLSTRSAPWARSNGQLRGLYSNQSPRSIRSAEMGRRKFHKSDQGFGGRSSSVDSIGSNDSSRRCRKRHHHHSSRHNSDNESEKSTKSGVSSRHHQHFYQNRQRRSAPSGRESESEFSDSQGMRRRPLSQHLDSGNQRTEEATWDRNMVGAPSVGTSGGRETESEYAGTARRNRRTNRSRSRSPGAAASRARNQLLPEQVRQHLAFDLVDPGEQGMSQEQLKDIPYTKVETNGRPLKIHYSPVAKKVYVKKGNGAPNSASSLGLPQQSSEETSSSAGAGQSQPPTDSPPPPYTGPTGPVSSTPIANTSAAPALSPSVEGDHVSSRSSSLRSSSTAQTAILRTPMLPADFGHRSQMMPGSRGPPMSQHSPIMPNYGHQNGDMSNGLPNGYGSLQRKPKPIVNNGPGSSATLPRNLHAHKQPPQQQQQQQHHQQQHPPPPPVMHPVPQMNWNGHALQSQGFQRDPYGPRMPMMPQNVNGNMIHKTSTPLVPRQDFRNGPRPMMMPTPPRNPNGMVIPGMRPPQPCSFDLPYRQFQPNHPNMNGGNNLPNMNTMGTMVTNHQQMNGLPNGIHPPQMAEGQFSPNYQNCPMTPPPPPPPQPFYNQYDQFHNYVNACANYQVPPPNPTPVEPPPMPPAPMIPHYSPVYNHQIITRNQEPISQQQGPSQHQLGIPVSSASRPVMYTPTRHPPVDHHHGPNRAPLPQPRNSYYFMNNDYVNTSQCQGPRRNTPMAPDHGIQRASSQELSTEL